MSTRKSSRSAFRQKINSLLLLKSSWFRKVIKAVWILLFCVVLGVPVYIYAVILNPFNLFGAMPSLKDIENPENDWSSELVSADGVSLGRYIRYHRRPVTYEQLSPLLVNTLIISEDHRFFDHSGMDLQSYLRVFRGIVTGSNQGGGSTLTQQTAKNLFRTRGAELQGRLASIGGPLELLISKTKEWIIAVQLERNYTKEEIIAMYLNTAPFNNNAYGIKVAAETYFSKGPEALNIQESALLVGMLQGTNRFNPIEYPERALRKRNQVLNKLYQHEHIKTEEEYDSIRALPIQLNFVVQNQNVGLATYFRDIVQKDIMAWCKEHGYNLYESGLRIHTTIDSRLQQFAEEAMAEHMSKLQRDFDRAWGRTRDPWVNDNGTAIEGFLQRKIKRTETYRNLEKKYGAGSDSIMIALHQKKKMRIFSWRGERDTILSSFDSLRYYNRFLQSGMMTMNPETGAVKAWVGGINHKYFKYDHVSQGTRQPGSTFKPFVYGKAIEDGYTPCEKFANTSPTIRVSGTVYHVKNSDGTYGDGTPYTMRQALARSLNSITIQLIDRLKPQNVVDFAQRLGIASKLDPVPSLGLGTSNVSLFEMVAAYSSFANLGIYTQPYFITRIEDKNGNIIENFVPKTRQAINETTAYAMVHMLKGGVEEEGGTSHGLSKAVLDNNEVGGKTGTTDNASDGWYIGITHNLVTGVWVGGDEPSIHFPSWGAGAATRSALPVWDKFMTKVYAHPETEYLKGYFKQPDDLKMTLRCEEYPQDSTFQVID
jgi:penicillin-binding protein 1A